MYCPRCGAQTSSICPRCDAHQSPRGGAGWLITVHGSGVSGGGLTATVKTFISRTWGEQGHFLSGDRWEAGEQEVDRQELSYVSVFAVDRHTPVARRPLCILTDRRLVILDVSGSCLQIRLRDIGSARRLREYDPQLDVSHWMVVLNRLGSSIRDSKGDICLYCADERQCARLTALIGRVAP